MSSYRLLRDRFEHKAGIIVYDCHLYDYGCSEDDMRATGIEHLIMTLEPNHGYPFFTVPITDVERLS